MDIIYPPSALLVLIDGLPVTLGKKAGLSGPACMTRTPASSPLILEKLWWDSDALFALHLIYIWQFDGRLLLSLKKKSFLENKCVSTETKIQLQMCKSKAVPTLSSEKKVLVL